MISSLIEDLCQGAVQSGDVSPQKYRANKVNAVPAYEDDRD